MSVYEAVKTEAMTKRDYSDTGQRSQSDELFEDIFQLALTKDQRKKKGAKPVVPTGKKSRAAPEASPAQTRKVSPAPPLVRSAAKSPERKIEKKEVTAKRPRSGIKAKLLILLLLLAAVSAAAAYLYPHLKLPGFFQSTPGQSTIKREMPPKPPEKPAVSEKGKPSPQVPVHVPPAVPHSGEGRTVETETQESFPPPTRVTQDTAKGSKPDADVEAPSRPSAPDGKDASPAGEQPTAAQTAQQSQAPANLTPPPLPTKAKSVPYSIYLGSFRKEEALQQALAIYRESELSPYVVRMDLGSKGVWLRVFSGHFETREEADAFIKKNQVSEAETKHTRYAVLVGEFSSKQEAEARARVLKDAGCHPYVIGVNLSSLRVYSGAYYRMEDAEKELAWLASKGVKGRIVER